MTAGLSRLIRRVLYGISALDPISYLAAVGLLMGILAIAALLPIGRAFQLDVASILKSD